MPNTRSILPPGKLAAVLRDSILPSSVLQVGRKKHLVFICHIDPPLHLPSPSPNLFSSLLNLNHSHQARLLMLILDEADLLLSYGYEEDLQLIAPQVRFEGLSSLTDDGGGAQGWWR